MPFAPGALAVPAILGLILARASRGMAGVAALATALLLNTWWIVDLPRLDILRAHVPAVLADEPGTPVLVVGHAIVVLLGLVAIGVFTPRPGSPVDLALRAASRRDYRASGEFWLEARRPRRALRAFLKAHAWDRAAETARDLGRLKRAAVLYQRDGGDSLAHAAHLWSRIGSETQAQSVWARHGQQLVEGKRFDQAIEPFLRAGDPRRAASAAEMALESGRLGTAFVDAAIRAGREAKRPQLAASIAISAGRFREAGDLFLAAEMPAEAAHAFSEAGDHLRAAEALRQAGQPEEAARVRARRLSDTGQIDLALAEYEEAGMQIEAARSLERLGRWHDAYERYLRAGCQREAAALALQHLDPRDAARLYADLGEWAEAGAAWERAGDAREAAASYERAGDFSRAEEVLRAADHYRDRANLLARVGRVEEAFRVVFERGDPAGAWDILSRHGGTFPGLAEELAGLANWLATHADLPTAISAVQRAVGGLPVQRGLLPAFYTYASLLEQQGDPKAAEIAWQRIVDFDYGYNDAAQRLQVVAARRAEEERMATLAAQSAAPDPSERYVLEKELGRGGMGVVYRATDTKLGRTVAIKVLNQRQHTPDAIDRFQDEARAAAALSHPGIVHIYDFDQGFGSHFISMEFVSGPTLTQLLRDDQAFLRRHLLALLRQIVDAVAYAHAHSIVHRDLKPANMILADRRQVKILDFGIARRLDEMESAATGATGTPFYMAPEQILGEEPDERTDIYALGVTFFQLATGTVPFPSGNILRAHLEQAPPDPRSLVPDLDAHIADVILQCLAKEENERPRDGAALLALLIGEAES